jgi:FixJ family two-component response regulator
MQTRKYIAVVDDDESVREALPDLLREFGYEAGGFSSAEEFLASDKFKQAEGLVLDIAMPGMSGLDLQRELIRRERKLPIVFITAYNEQAARLRSREQGAVECLLKPFSDTELAEALQAVLKSN